MNIYERFYEMYKNANEDLRKESKEHWLKCHSENVAADREDLIIFSARHLAIIAMIEESEQPKKRKALFKRGADIPKQIRNRTYYNMKHYYLDLYDAFKEAVSALYHIAPKELQEAWYNEDFREYIPSEYVD